MKINGPTGSAGRSGHPELAGFIRGPRPELLLPCTCAALCFPFGFECTLSKT